MTLQEFLNGLTEFIRENPDAINLQVITSKDDEGTGFNEVHYSPGTGYFDGESFNVSGHLKEDGQVTRSINAVCIN